MEIRIIATRRSTTHFVNGDPQSSSPTENEDEFSYRTESPTAGTLPLILHRRNSTNLSPVHVIWKDHVGTRHESRRIRYAWSGPESPVEPVEIPVELVMKHVGQVV